MRFTQRASAKDETLFALFLERLADRQVTIRDLRAGAGAVVRDLASGRAVEFRQDGDDLTLAFADAPPDTPAHAVAISWSH